MADTVHDVWVNASAVLIAAAAFAATAWQGFLLRRQIAQSDNISRSTFYQTLALRFADLNRLFVDRPELAKYFHDGADLTADGDERAAVEAVCALITNLADLCYSCEAILCEFSRDWDSYFRFVYEKSPVFRDYIAKHGRFWPDRIGRSFAPLPETQ